MEIKKDDLINKIKEKDNLKQFMILIGNNYHMSFEQCLILFYQDIDTNQDFSFINNKKEHFIINTNDTTIKIYQKERENIEEPIFLALEELKTNCFNLTHYKII